MEVAKPKPRLGSQFVRSAFMQHFGSRKVGDDWGYSQKRTLRAIAISKNFAVNISVRLDRTKFHLSNGNLSDEAWNGPFEQIFSGCLNEQQAMIFIALIKPKIDTVSVLVDSFRLSDFNPAIYKPITNCLIGVQHLNIKDTVIVPSCCELLESLGPNLSRLECPLKYLEHELPLMNLDTLVVEFGEDTIDLTPLFSNHLIRRLQMHFLRSYKDDEIVCGDRLLNPSVEELVLTDVHCSSVRLPKRVAKHLPNLKRVIFFLKTDFWEYKLNDKLISMIECTQKWVQESPNLHFVFYVYVAGSCNENPVGFVRELCKLGVASNEQSFVPIKKIEVDPDIKLCPCYEWEYKMPEILVCLNGQIKFFFWRLQLEKVLDDLYFF